MKTLIFIIIHFVFIINIAAQKDPPKGQKELTKDQQQQVLGQINEGLMKGVLDEICNCIDSLNTLNKSDKQKENDMLKCIEDHADIYQMVKQMASGNDNIEIEVFEDDEFKSSDLYREIKDEVVRHCYQTVQDSYADNLLHQNSLSDDPKAQEQYDLGIKHLKKEEYKEAIPYFKKAVKIDPNFAFAWDNLGVCYRRTNQLDKAISAYKKSLEVEPNGTFPIQNIAVAYESKGDYKEAIKYYEKLPENNPERYYGIAREYIFLNDLDKAVDNMCKAFNLYMDQGNPLSADAETILSALYEEYEKSGKEEEFFKILEDNNINVR